MSAQRNMKRKDLFLLRLWTEEASDSEGGTHRLEWRGKLQRVVDGESRRFSNLQDLSDLLATMLSTSRSEGPKDSAST
jgi:hypothetical protein